MIDQQRTAVEVGEKPGASKENYRRAIFAALYLLFILFTAGTVLGGYSVWKYGSLADAAAHVQGRKITVTPEIIEVPIWTDDETHKASCTIKNVSDRTISLIGSDACCEYQITRGLHEPIAPGKIQILEISILRPQALDNMRVLGIYTDDAHVAEFKVRVLTVARK